MLPRRSLLTTVFENLPVTVPFNGKRDTFKRALELLIQEKLTDPRYYRKFHPFCFTEKDIRYVKRWFDVMTQAEESKKTEDKFEEFLQEHDLSVQDHERWLIDPRSYHIDSIFRCLDELSSCKDVEDIIKIDQIFVEFENIIAEYLHLPMIEFAAEVKEAIEKKLGKEMLELMGRNEKTWQHHPKSEVKRLS